MAISLVDNCVAVEGVDGVAQWLRPFSPSILSVSIDNRLIGTLAEAADTLLADDRYCRDKQEPSPVLAHVSRRVLLDSQMMLGGTDVAALFQAVCRDYAISVSHETATAHLLGGVAAVIDAMWLNEQRAGDFIPLHCHAGDLSGVLYLKVPGETCEIGGAEGAIEFVDGRAGDRFLVRHRHRITPRPGDLLVFPSWLLHTVYPFSAQGAIRSAISFNAVLTVPSKNVEA